MRILICGGAGYIGCRVTETLLNLGHNVEVVDLLWFGNHLPNHPNLTLFKKDVLDLKIGDLEGYEQVIFLAGVSSVPIAELSPGKNFIHNAAAPAYLAHIAKQSGVKRLICASSCSVYEYVSDKICVETDPPLCKHPYAVGKLMGEVGIMHHANEDFSVICFRQGTVCGYSPRMRFDLLINSMVKYAIKNGVVNVVNPELHRPVVGMSDMCQAYVKAVWADYSVSGIFNIASKNYTIGEVADTVCEMLDCKSNVQTGPDRRSYQISIDKAVNVLGYHPVEFSGSIVNELRNELRTFSDWDDPVYYNKERLI